MLAAPGVWFIALGQFYGLNIKPIITHQDRIVATDVLINHTAKHMQMHKDGPPYDTILALVCALDLVSTPITPALVISTPALVISTPVPIVSPTEASGTKAKLQRSTYLQIRQEGKSNDFARGDGPPSSP